MTLVDLLVHSLATWRVSNMLVSERGPFDVFIWVRSQTGILHYDDGSIAQVNPTNPLSCLWCTSVWVALFLGLLPACVLRALAASALAIAIRERVLNGES